jgi:periplasmic protein TonB
VFVSFVIEKDGSLTDIKVLKDAGFGTGDEAIRVLKKCKNWVPGEQSGKKVRCSYTLPINLKSN